MPWLRSVGLAMTLAFGAGIGESRAQDALKDLRLPLEFYLSGQVKTELFAEEAVVGADGSINATGITFRFLTEAGAEDGIVKAERCVCNRNDQTATSDSAVSLTRKGLQITGVGFEWHAAGKRLKILSQARVELARPAITKERILERE